MDNLNNPIPQPPQPGGMPPVGAAPIGGGLPPVPPLPGAPVIMGSPVTTPPRPPMPNNPAIGLGGPMQENPTLNSQNQTAGGMPKKKGSSGKLIMIIILLLVLVGGGGAAAYYFMNGGFGSSEKPTTQNTNKNTEITTLNGGEPVVLEYWGLWDDQSVYQEAFDAFTQKFPNVQINYVVQAPQDYRERLQSALARGEGPDIFRFHNTWVPMLRNELAQLPETVMSQSTYQESFYPVIYQDLSSDNGIVGMPLMIDGLGLYYNQAVFDIAGKKVPETWDELRKTAIDLTIRTGQGVERAGIALGLTHNVDHFSDIVGLMLLQNGANPAEPTNSLALDAINFYLIFQESDKIWNGTLPNSTAAFALEKAAMMIAPSWRAHEVRALNPDIDFAIAPVPQLPESEVSWATYWAEGVSNQSENQEAAWVLLEYLTEKESLRSMYTAASQSRLFGNPFPRVDMAEQLLGDPFVGAYIQQAPYAKSWPMVSSTFDNGINDRNIKYYEDALNSGSKELEGSVKTITNGVTQVLSNYGVGAE